MNVQDKVSICRGKVRHATKAAARVGKAVVSARTHRVYRIYRCAVCKGYHLTTDRPATVLHLLEVIAEQRS